MVARSGDCDVLVVGAGIGGLTAAALLASRGLSVVVFERREAPGGCCSVFSQDGYQFDLASSVFYGFGQEGFNANRRVLDELGVHLDTVVMDPIYELFLGDERFRVFQNLEQHLEALDEWFPISGPALKTFYEKIEVLYKQSLEVGFLPVADASLFNLATMAFGNPSLLFKYLPRLKATLWDYLGPMLPSSHGPKSQKEVRRLKEFMDIDMAFGTCASTDEVPLLLAVPLLMDRHRGGVVYPKGGSASLPAALEHGLKKHGGTIHYHAEVERILTNSGRVEGVRTKGGEVVRSARVVTNVNIWDTFQKLLDSYEVNTKRRKEVQSLEPSFSVFTTCVGVDAKLVQEGTHAHSVVIPQPDGGVKDAAIVTIPSLIDPFLAPEGRHAVTITTVDDYKEWVPAGFVNARENPDLSAQRTARALTRAESLLPGISEAGEVIHTASPATWESQFGRRFGVVGGPAQILPQSLDGRQGNTTEIKGLYLVGDSTFPGEGVVAVTLSGLLCADQITSRRGPELSPWASMFRRLKFGER